MTWSYSVSYFRWCKVRLSNVTKIIRQGCRSVSCANYWVVVSKYVSKTSNYVSIRKRQRTRTANPNQSLKGKARQGIRIGSDTSASADSETKTKCIALFYFYVAIAPFFLIAQVLSLTLLQTWFQLSMLIEKRRNVYKVLVFVSLAPHTTISISKRVWMRG